MDVTALLTADHNRVRGLFSRFTDAKESEDTARLTSLGATIASELDVHTTIEEEVFYPWVRGLSDELAEVVDEGIQEHHVVRSLLEEIAMLPAASDDWLAKMAVVIENVEHHANEEETEMFPSLRGASTAEDRERVGSELELKKAALGAPVLQDKIDLTTSALREMASEQQIPGRSKMSHDELAATVAPG